MEFKDQGKPKLNEQRKDVSLYYYLNTAGFSSNNLLKRIMG